MRRTSASLPRSLPVRNLPSAANPASQEAIGRIHRGVETFHRIVAVGARRHQAAEPVDIVALALLRVVLAKRSIASTQAAAVRGRASERPMSR